MTINTLLRKFEEAARADEVCGSAHPLERDSIHAHFIWTKKVLRLALKSKLSVTVEIPRNPTKWPSQAEINKFNENEDDDAI